MVSDEPRVGRRPPRVLFITEYALLPATKGGRQRTNLLARALSEVANVDIFWINGDEPVTDPDAIAAIRERFNVIGQISPQEPSDVGMWRLLRRLNPQLANRGLNFARPADRYLSVRPKHRDELRRACSLDTYDLIVGRYLHALARTDVLGSRPCIADIDDFDSVSVETRLEHGKLSRLHALMDRRALPLVRERESRLIESCDAVWVAAGEDLKRVGSTRASVLPNIPFVPEGELDLVSAPLPSSDTKALVTVGNLKHVPHVQGIDAFLDGPWLRIRRAVPDAVFRIVGSGLDPRDRMRWEKVPGVEVVGFARDVGAVYRDCAATICNASWGAGTNIKIVESFAYGRTALASKAAIRGWGSTFVHDESVCVCEDDDAVVDNGVRLLLDRAYRERLARTARALASEHFSMRTFSRIVANTLHAVI